MMQVSYQTGELSEMKPILSKSMTCENKAGESPIRWFEKSIVG